jgi:HD-GYP domain-containing protein (c-di-GMP phosphodiesterase class II)
MTSDRPYRLAKREPAAVEELKRCAGAQFDGEVVKAFAEMLTRYGMDARPGPPAGASS